MNQKDKFLQDVTKDIKYIFARKKIRKELENHILEGLDAGFSEDEVISDMGDPKVISNEFNEVYKPVQFLVPILSLTLIFLLTFIGSQYYKARALSKLKFEHGPLTTEEENVLMKHIEDKRKINKTITLGHVEYQFNDIYLSEGNIYISYNFNKPNHFIRETVMYYIHSCNKKTCEKGYQINGSIDPSSRKGYLIFEGSELPVSVILEFQHKLLIDKTKTLELVIGGKA